jgi:hypothetical protein
MRGTGSTTSRASAADGKSASNRAAHAEEATRLRSLIVPDPCATDITLPYWTLKHPRTYPSNAWITGSDVN